MDELDTFEPTLSDVWEALQDVREKLAAQDKAIATFVAAVEPAIVDLQNSPLVRMLTGSKRNA